MNAFLLVAVLCADPDIESMKASLQARISAFEQLNGSRKGGDHIVVTPHEAAKAGSGVQSETAAPEPVSNTAVCQCRGSNRGVCFCLQNRVACKCNSGKGSVWNLKDGRAVSKTGQYADPRGASAIARRDAPAGTAPADDTVPRKRSDGRYWWKGSNGWFGTATLTEGQTYLSGTNRFVYQGGKMHEGATMAADITPKGHWVRRCYGGYCRMEWVAE